MAITCSQNTSQKECSKQLQLASSRPNHGAGYKRITHAFLTAVVLVLSFLGFNQQAQAHTTLTKTTSTPTVAPGGIATYTINQTDTGTSSNTTLLTINDTLPTGFTYLSTQSVTLGGGTTRSPITNPTVGSNTPSWGAFNQLYPYTNGTNTVSIVFSAQVPVGGLCGKFNNSVGATSTGPNGIHTYSPYDGTLTANTAEDVTVTGTLNVAKTTSTPIVTNTPAGTQATYTLVVTNPGQCTVPNVNITDALPTGFTYASTGAVTFTGTATRPSTTNPTVGATAPSWGSFTIPGGDSVTLTFTANVATTVTDGTYNNSANANTTTAGITINSFNGANSTAEDVQVISANLAVTKTTSTPTVTNTATGAQATYTLTVTNSGTAAATGVKVTDTLSTGFTYGSTTSVTANGTAVAPSGYAVTGTTTPQWDTSPTGGFTINAGQTIQIVFTANVANTVANGTYNNSASVTSNAKTSTNFDGTPAGTTVDNVTVGSAVLTVTKTTSTPTVTNTPTGAQATYTVTVTNSGTAAATGVKVTDTLPTGFTYGSTTNVTANGTAVTSGNYAVTGTTTPQWDTSPTGGFTVNAGQTLVIVFTANVANTVVDGTYNNSASVTSNAKTSTNFDGTPAGTTVDNVTVGSAVLTVTKTTSTPTITNTATGAQATYTVTVTNSGTGAANGIKLTDTLPAGFTYNGTTGVTASGIAVAASGYSVTGTTTPQWDTNPTGGFTLPAGKTLVIVFTANVANTVADGTYNNSASVTSPSAKTITNFVGTASTTDDVKVDSITLSVTKTTSTPTIVNTPTGAQATYTITVGNSGSADDTGVKVQDVLPAGFTYNSTVSITANGIAIVPTGYTVTGTTTLQWDTNPTGGFTVKKASQLVIVFTANVANTVADGTYNNSASVTSPNAKNIVNFNGANSTAENVQIVSASLVVTKTTSTPAIVNTPTGTQATYTLTVTNSGAATAIGIKVTDILPAGFTYGSTTSVTVNDIAVALLGYTVTGTTTPQWNTNPAGGFTLPASKTLVIVFTANIANTVADGTYNNSANATSTNATAITNFDGANSTIDDVTVGIPANPRLRLVKRITAINASPITTVVDPATTTDPNDNAPNWPAGYLQGAINGGLVRPGDELEYTIYFLSDGDSIVKQVQLCDLISTNSTFSPRTFDGLTPTDGGLPGADAGVAVAIGPTTTYLSNVRDTDRGEFFVTGSVLPASCSSAINPDGAIVVNVVTNTTTPSSLPNATSPGNPTNSYGFIRFRAKVN